VEPLDREARGLVLAQVGPLLRLVEQALEEIAAEGLFDDLVIGPARVARLGACAGNERRSTTGVSAR
jgi:hypothetical protein